MERYLLVTKPYDDPVLLGPYETDLLRDQEAKSLYYEEGDSGLIVPLDLNKNGWQHVAWRYNEDWLACDEDENCADDCDDEDDDCFVSCCDEHAYAYDRHGNHPDYAGVG